MSNSIKKTLIILIALTLFFTSAIVILAVQNISSEDSKMLIASQRMSKSLIMCVLDSVEDIFGSEDYAPTPFDSSEFSYADLSHPYFTDIRNDKRISHFYIDGNAIDFADAIRIREYLRDLFPHGAESSDFLHVNVLDMIDAAENGEKFVCGNISKMLVQLVQAGGTQARTVGLQASHSGHVVVELWSEMYDKWVVLDPDYNVHYTNSADIPLSVKELYEMSQDGNSIKNINAVTGKSKNTLHNKNSNLIELYYKNGFAINFYNAWVDKNYPRRHPARSPAIMAYYLGNSTLDSLYYKHDSDLLTDKVNHKLYMKPSAYE